MRLDCCFDSAFLLRGVEYAIGRLGLLGDDGYGWSEKTLLWLRVAWYECLLDRAGSVVLTSCDLFLSLEIVELLFGDGENGLADWSREEGGEKESKDGGLLN